MGETYTKGNGSATLAPDQVLYAMAVIQISFCIRWGIEADWDVQKFIIFKANIHYKDRGRLEKILGTCMMEVRADFNAMDKAVDLLHPKYHDAVFMACARIVALNGFTQDIDRLERLKTLMAIDDYRAGLIIDIAKREAEMIGISGRL